MTPERWQRIREVYFQISEAPTELRPKLLAELTAGDPALAQAVDQLLISPPDGEAALDHPPFGDSPLPFPATTSLIPGELLANRFEILSHLGSGGMGEVYEAEDRDLQTRVAVKVIRPDVAANPAVVSRFRREIALARKITHRSVCRVFDFFPAATTSHNHTIDFLTMEVLRGETLSRYLTREAPLTLDKALPLLSQLAEGLEAAHAALVLHRDLKGSNILLTNDANGLRLVITDFGLARSHRSDPANQSTATLAAGTPLYMSPEQLEGGELTPASDLYSFGVLMYEMATGVPPYQGESPMQVVIRRVKEERPPAPSTINPKIDPRWEATILRCLAYHPQDRFTSATALLEALGGPVPPPPPRQPLRLRPALAAIAFLLLALSAFLWLRPSLPPLSPEANRWYEQSISALNNGSMARASSLLENTLKLAQDSVAVRCRLAETYLELDRRDNAQEQLLAALKLPVRSAEERALRTATEALVAGQWAELLAAAQSRVKNAAPANRTTAMLDYARWLERANQNDQAQATYQTILAEDPSQPGALLRLANLKAATKDTSAALDLLHRAKQAFGVLNNAEGLGEVALARSRLVASIDEGVQLAVEAETLATQAEATSLLVRSQLWRADRIERQGKLEESRALTTKAIALAESSGLYAEAINAYLALAIKPYSLGNYEQAEAEFKRILTLARRYRTLRGEARTKVSLAMSYVNTNQSEQALPLVAEAIAFYQATGLAVPLAQAYGVQGDAYLRVGRYALAKASLQTAFDKSLQPEARNRIRRRQANLASATADYAEAAKIHQQILTEAQAAKNLLAEQSARLDLADSLAALGRFPEAAAQLDAITEATPKSPRIAWQLEAASSNLDYQQGRYEPALQRLEALHKKTLADKQDALERDTRGYLCVQYQRGTKQKVGIPICEKLLQEYANQPSELITYHHALSQMFRITNRIAPSLFHASQALKYSAQLKATSDIWYSHLLLALAHHQNKDESWRASRQQARSVLNDFEKEIGPTAMQSFLGRYGTRQLWQSVEQLQ
jgi:serine/threonine protein kinase